MLLNTHTPDNNIAQSNRFIGCLMIGNEQGHPQKASPFYKPGWGKVLPFCEVQLYCGSYDIKSDLIKQLSVNWTLFLIPLSNNPTTLKSWYFISRKEKVQIKFLPSPSAKAEDSFYLHCTGTNAKKTKTSQKNRKKKQFRHILNSIISSLGNNEFTTLNHCVL